MEAVLGCRDPERVFGAVLGQLLDDGGPRERLDAIRAPVYLWLASSSAARGSGGCTRALSTRKVQSREITATHFELLRAPHVAQLAAELAVRLLE